MSGAMLETEARRLRDEYLQEGINLGIGQGISQGIGQGISQVAENMIRAQKPAEEIESINIRVRYSKVYFIDYLDYFY